MHQTLPYQEAEWPKNCFKILSGAGLSALLCVCVCVYTRTKYVVARLRTQAEGEKGD